MAHTYGALNEMDDYRIVPVSEIENRDGDICIDPFEADGFDQAPPVRRNLVRRMVPVDRLG